MPTTKHTATAPNGQTFKRSSATKVYSHVVVGRRCKDWAIRHAQSKQWDVNETSNYEYYASIVANGRSKYCTSDEDAAKSVAHALERLQGAESLEAFLAAALERRLAAIEATDFSEYRYLGWTSRLDLAQKLQAKEASGYYAEVLILEAHTA